MIILIEYTVKERANKMRIEKKFVVDYDGTNPWGAELW